MKFIKTSEGKYININEIKFFDHVGPDVYANIDWDENEVFIIQECGDCIEARSWLENFMKRLK